jgi:choline dehydrogenase
LVAVRLCVNGVTGLRVVGCSVMSTLVPGNTHAAAVMLTKKAADMVREDGDGTF